ncbi:FAD-binding monooxygenase [Methylobacterium sp. Leaf104]|uniref:FAD-dependent monooxygenase n=1 Tax=Methylobacterium TaxID=407 RepID=UPI0006F3D6D1|nr:MULTISPECIES: FAD-dependent monooxygenase [Methylobacterium]KQP31746.1 FAD-binding monooxygenase [Methylobacterium sp. Leaf104]MCI9880663.1 FAD-dependent monooxygenase [Methylobacterium goesingense]
MADDATNRVLIAGLAMARALHRRGMPGLVLERRADVAEAGLAINLPGNAVQALAQLGLADALGQVGSPIRRREYRTERGRLLFAVDEGAFWGARAHPRCVRRGDLLRLLADGLPADAVRRGRAVAAIRQSAGDVSVELADGAVERGGWLVGADGVHSAVRRSVFGEAAPSPALLGQASWRFMARNPGLDAWTLWAGAGGLFLLIPVDRDEVYGWASVGGAGAAGRDLAAVRRVFDRFPQPVQDTLDRILLRPDAIHHSPLEEVRVAHWTEGRVLLMGDAAHATAPVWAQGAALALEDALVLAGLLAGGGDRDGIGPAYEALRRPRVGHIQAMTDRLSRTATMPDWARNLLLPLIGPRSYRATYAKLRVPVSA